MIECLFPRCASLDSSASRGIDLAGFDGDCLVEDDTLSFQAKADKADNLVLGTKSGSTKPLWAVKDDDLLVLVARMMMLSPSMVSVTL